MLAAMLMVTVLLGAADAPERSARLLDETAKLEAQRPKLLPPLLLFSGGTAAALGGAALVWTGLVTAYWYAFTFATGAVVLFTVGVVLLAVGLPLAIIGAVKLRRTLAARAEIDRQLEGLTVATF